MQPMPRVFRAEVLDWSDIAIFQGGKAMHHYEAEKFSRLRHFCKTGRSRRAWARSVVGGVAIAALVTIGFGASASAQTFGGNVSVTWSIPGAPATGLSDVTFYETIGAETAQQAGTYFAQQFRFTNTTDVGYTGLQPRAPLNGVPRLHGVFSSFISGTTSTDANCTDGADGGAGVSCAADFDGVYGHRYALTVKRIAADTWSGTATDTVTGKSTHIGSYRLPTGSGALYGGQVGFVEYYDAPASCSELPPIHVTFDGPTSTASGGLTGRVSNPYEYGASLGQANYHAAVIGAGVDVARGWGAPATAPLTDGLVYEFVDTATNQAIDDPAWSTAAGTQQTIWTVNGGQNQQWTAHANSDGSYTLVNRFSGLCLDNAASSTAAGNPIIQWDCTGGTNQDWDLRSVTNGYQLVNRASGLAIAPQGASAGSPLVQQSGSGSTWSVTKAG